MRRRDHHATLFVGDLTRAGAQRAAVDAMLTRLGLRESEAITDLTFRGDSDVLELVIDLDAFTADELRDKIELVKNALRHDFGSAIAA
jgi:hypothetical protein